MQDLLGQNFTEQPLQLVREGEGQTLVMQTFMRQILVLQLGLIIVDYLQLMQSSESSENRAIEVANITRSLKILAKELNVPVVAFLS